MAAEMRLSRGAMLDLNTILLTTSHQRLAMKLLGVVDMDTAAIRAGHSRCEAPGQPAIALWVVRYESAPEKRIMSKVAR